MAVNIYWYRKWVPELRTARIPLRTGFGKLYQILLAKYTANTLQSLMELLIYCCNILPYKLMSNPFQIVTAANCTELIRKKKLKKKLESEI